MLAVLACGNRNVKQELEGDTCSKKQEREEINFSVSKGQPTFELSILRRVFVNGLTTFL